jgi:hypothetical protein
MSNVMQQSQILPTVRTMVKEKLLQNPKYLSLPLEQRKAIAQDTVTALTYILGGEDGRDRPNAVTLADREGTIKDFTNVSGDDSGETAQDKFKRAGAVAAKEGTDRFKDLVNSVDFPKFVSGLIDGVFNAINKSTMSQLAAYSDLVKNVAKSVEEYMSDNVSQNNARDYLANKYPNHLQIGLDDNGPQLQPKDGADDTNMPDFMKDLGLPKPVDSLDQDTVEQQLVPAARRRMALDRQQLLATMVMMGVNRLVVTDGTIDASVLFDINTTDSLRTKYQKQARLGDTQYSDTYSGESGSETKSSGGGIFGGLFGGDQDNSSRNWYKGQFDDESVNLSVSTARSDDSESKIKMHSTLSGKVHVNFKSDYFPMEKMVNIFQLQSIQEKSPAAVNAAAGSGASSAPGSSTATPSPATTAPAK